LEKGGKKLSRNAKRHRHKTQRKKELKNTLKKDKGSSVGAEQNRK